MNYQIFLVDADNNQYAELDYDNNDFQASFSVADLSDLNTRKDPIVKNITFKGTKNNNRIFGNLSSLNRDVSSTIPSKLFFNFSLQTELTCIVFENNSQIFKGLLHFQSLTRDQSGNILYQFSLKGFVVDFFSKLNNRFLSDLDFTEFNHKYSIENIKNSWLNTSGTGFTYPFIDFGSNPINTTEYDNKISYRNFRPAFYLRTYFDKIFSQPGSSGYTYTLTGNTFFNEVINKIIIPNNDLDFSFSKSEILMSISKTINPISYTGANQFTRDNANNRDIYNNIISFDTTNSYNANGIINQALTGGNRIEITNSLNTTVTADVTFVSSQNNGINNDVVFRALYRTAPNLQFNAISESVINYNYNDPNGTFVRDNPAKTLKLDFNYQFQAGSQLGFVVYINGDKSKNFNIRVLNCNVTIGSTTTQSAVSLNLNDDAVLISQNSKSIAQADFMKSVLQTFNLYCYASPIDNKHIIIQPYNDYYENFNADKIISNAVDFTDKIDNSSNFQIEPVQDLFNLYSFKTKEDSDYYNSYYKKKFGETYGNYQITGNTNSQSKSLETLFSATPVPFVAGRNVPAIFTIESNLKKQQVSNLRLLFYNGLKNCTSFEIGRVDKNAVGDYGFYSIDAANYTFSSYPEADEKTVTSDGQFIDLVWGQPKEVLYTSGGFISSYTSDKKTLFDYFYSDQVAELTNLNTKIIQVQANLSELDIENLDLRKPVFINSELGSGYYKINEIEYQNSSELASVTLQSATILDNITPFSGYKNSIYTAILVKNDCLTANYQGSSSIYVVPEGKYTSVLSQNDADNMAKYEATTNGQAYANANGNCIYTATTFNLKTGTSPSEAIASSNASVYITDLGNLNIGSTIYTYYNNIPAKTYSGYYVDDNQYYHTDSQSTIFETGTTASLSATTYDYFFVDSGSNYLSCQRATDGTGLYQNYKLSDPYPQLNTIVKQGDGITLVNDMWYSDGQFSYQTLSGSIITLANCTVKNGRDPETVPASI